MLIISLLITGVLLGIGYLLFSVPESALPIPRHFSNVKGGMIYTYDRIDGMLWCNEPIFVDGHCITSAYGDLGDIAANYRTAPPIKYVIGETMTPACAKVIVKLLGGELTE